MILRRIPLTLSFYIGKQFLLSFLLVLCVMAGIIFTVDLVELLRRSASSDAISPAMVIELGLLKSPSMIQRVVPFAVLIGSILTLSRLTRSQELVVARASGVSVWQFLFPVMAASLCIGLLILGVINPLNAAMLARFEQLEAGYFKGKASLMAVSSSGLWLRQSNDEIPKMAALDSDEIIAPLALDSVAEPVPAVTKDMPKKHDGRHFETIVHALRVSPDEMRLFDVIIFTFGQDGQFMRRIDAREAVLHSGYWALSDALITAPAVLGERHDAYNLPTNLTASQIQESFASPETLSFWELPEFISTLEEAGFSGLRHRLYLHNLLASPLFLCAMVLIGAGFALRPHRLGGTGILITMGVSTGFLLYFITDLVNALALSATLPVVVAAWSMSAITTIVGVVALLHFEDG